jgi:hypothetical protein
MAEESKEPEDLVRTLLATWRELEPYTGNGHEEFRALGDPRVIDRWRSLFGPELVYVRSVRNLVAHSPNSMPESELREAVKAARKLRDLLFSGLQNPAAVLGA